MKAIPFMVIMLSCISISFAIIGCGTPQDYLSQDMVHGLEESILKNKDKDPLVGIWRSSYGGIEAKIAVNFNPNGGEKLKAVVLNGDEVGFAYYNGHPWFHVTPTAKNGIYTGKVCYQNNFGIEHWFSTKIVFMDRNEFTMYDDVPSHYLVYGGTTHDYIRIGESWTAGDEIEETVSKTGTGFAISENGLIATACHIVKDAKTINVYLATDSFVSARVLHSDPVNDLAVIKIEKPTPNFLQIAPIRSLKTGDRVFTIGFPVSSVLGKEAKYTEGVVSSLSGIQGASSLLQITVPVQPGNSGGPLVNEKGEVVGIITSSAAILPFIKESGTLPQNINWAVKTDYLRPLIELPKAGQKEFDREQLIEYVKKSTFFIETE